MAAFAGTNYNAPTPSLDLRFAEKKSLRDQVSGKDLVTFTRASLATYVDANGVVQSAASGTPRFDHDPTTGESLGLLVEEARTNNLLYSEQFDNAYWTKDNTTVIPNAAIAPDGTLTADLLYTTTSGVALIYRGLGPVASSLYTNTIYLKSAGFTWAFVVGAQGNIVAYFNLITGTVGTVGAGLTASISPVGNGWYRCSVTHTVTYLTFHVGPADASGSLASTPSGTSGIYAWGAQLEAGAFPTSYIPTPPTFTGRASTATYYDANGIIQTAASGVARSNAFLPDSGGVFRPAGLLLEAAGTNLVTMSEEFNGTAWGKTNVTITANATTAPDGTTTADKVLASNTTGIHSIFPGAIGVGTYTFSVFAKKSEYSRLVINYYGISFNLDTGVIESTLPWQYNSSAKIEKFANGWYRCSVTGTAYGNLYLSLANAAPSGNLNDPPSFTGDGTSGIFLWGAQLEASPYPTSYIPTVASTVTRAADTSTSATVTRSADVATITGTNFSSWYRQDEGTMFALHKAQPAPYVSPYGHSVWQLDRPSGSGGWELGLIYHRASSFYAVRGGSTDGGYVSIGHSDSVGSTTRAAFKWSNALNETRMAYNGTLSSIIAKGAGTNIDRLNIGYAAAFNDYSGYVNTTISRITYWPTRLPDPTLQSLTLTR
jgi:hypothetical protein